MMIAQLCLATLILAASSASGAWPQFRGPTQQGHADGVDLPLTWSETENVVWKTAIEGEGWSSPVIQGSQIWLTTAIDQGHGLRAICVDRASGEIVYDVPVFDVEQPPEIHATNSFASPTPVIEGNRVYVHFGAMGTACLDTLTGQIVWQNRELHVDHQVGPGGSPVIHDDLLLMTCDGIDARFVAALNKRDGTLAWRTDRSGVIEKPVDTHKAFGTPLLIRVDGQDQAVMQGAEWVHAYDPHTGEELWSVKYPGFSNVPRPVYGHGLLYVCTGYMKPEMWAIRPEGRGDLTANVAWKVKRQAPAKPSPLLVGKRLYMVHDTGVLTCLNAITGQNVWRKRLDGKYSASPVLADGRLYFLNEAGMTTVLAPGDQFDKLAENRLDGRFMASPAVAGRAFFLRTDTHLYRIEQ